MTVNQRRMCPRCILRVSHLIGEKWDKYVYGEEAAWRRGDNGKKGRIEERMVGSRIGNERTPVANLKIPPHDPQ
jgi:hypothetical protein